MKDIGQSNILMAMVLLTSFAMADAVLMMVREAEQTAQEGKILSHKERTGHESFLRAFWKIHLYLTIRHRLRLGCSSSILSAAQVRIQHDGLDSKLTRGLFLIV